jgi:CRP-like cAMP-binding protein
MRPREDLQNVEPEPVLSRYSGNRQEILKKNNGKGIAENKIKARGGAKFRSKPIATDRDGNRIHNKILLQLPANEGRALLSRLEFVRLKTDQVLHEAQESIRSVYFVDSGLTSVLGVMKDGRYVDVGLIGREGLVGLAVVGGFRKSFTRVVVRVDATAFRLDADVLVDLLAQSPELRRQLQRFSHVASVELAQISACKSLHQVPQRLARRLLMSQDRIRSDSLPLTQESLALMLGTHRPSVTAAAGSLQRAGIISYTRGNITILSRPALEAASCECYQLIRQHIEQGTSSGS